MLTSDSSNPSTYGACQKRQPHGGVDGCGQYESSLTSKSCEACGCHRSFHVVQKSATPATSIESTMLPMLANVSSSQPHLDTSLIAHTTSIDSTISPSSRRSTSSDVTSPSLNQPSSIPPPLSSFPEYPDGDITIEIKAHQHDDYGHTGWATMATSFWKLKGIRKGTARKLKCLGVLLCPVLNCSFVARPARDPSRLSAQASQVTCIIHKGHVIHQRCNASLTWKEVHYSEGCIHILLHASYHNHPKPPQIRPPPSAYHRLQQQVLTAPSTLPKQMLIGSSFLPSVRDIHGSFENLDRLAYHRRNVLKKAKQNAHITNILTWQEVNPDFIVSSSINKFDGYIFMQTPQQSQWCSSFTGILQTDALESFVDGPGNTVLCVTSGFLEVIGRTVPLACTLLFGKTEVHYRQHFRHLFGSLNMKLEEVKDQFQETSINDNKTSLPEPIPIATTHSNVSLTWSCMVVDFSTAQHMAFLHEFAAAVIKANHDLKPELAPAMAQSYIRGCQIHYFRSAVRVARISQFIHLTTELVNADISRFVNIIHEIKSTFPLTEKWLNWYLHEDRARLIFKAFSSLADKWNSTVGNTNAQEGTGRDIKYTAVRTKLSLFDAIDHLHRYIINIHSDITSATEGAQLRYSRSKKHRSRKNKTTFVNDGRPPDTTQQLHHSNVSSATTPYRMAYNANIQQQKQVQLNHSQPSPVDHDLDGNSDTSALPANSSALLCTQFIKNKNSSCYASSVLFLLYQLRNLDVFKAFVQHVSTLLPSNLTCLMTLIDRCNEQKFVEAREKMMKYIWDHPDGANKNKFESFAKFFHVFLVQNPNDTHNQSTSNIYHNFNGITYLYHTNCTCGINTNKALYNTMYECCVQHVQSMDVKPPVSVEELINFRHLHSHEISLCPNCKSERMHWFSIVSVPFILVVNMEDVRSSNDENTKNSIIPLKNITIQSIQGEIHMRAVGYLTYSTNHWTSSAIHPNGDSVYYFNDLHGYISTQPFNASKLSSPSTSAIVYVRQYPQIWTENIETHMSLFTSLLHYHGMVTLLDRAMQPVGEGTLMSHYIDNHAIVLLISVLQADASTLLPLRLLGNDSQSQSHDQQQKLAQFIGRCVVWESTLLQQQTIPVTTTTCMGDNDAPSSLAPVSQPTVRGRKKRTRTRGTVENQNQDEQSSVSTFNIDVERMKAKTRRQARTVCL